MKTDPDLVMILNSESSYGGITVAWASFGYWNANREMRNPSFDTWQSHPGYRNRGLQDFGVRAQRDPGPDRQFYAWRPQYQQPYTVELAEAEVMVKTLRQVERALERKQQADGPARDLATFLIRTAQVFGCRTFATHSTKLRADGTHWITGGPDYAQSWVYELEHPAASAA
jgi:hypothetical protein